jgi:hypothetical protein
MPVAEPIQGRTSSSVDLSSIARFLDKIAARPNTKGLRLEILAQTAQSATIQVGENTTQLSVDDLDSLLSDSTHQLTPVQSNVLWFVGYQGRAINQKLANELRYTQPFLHEQLALAGSHMGVKQPMLAFLNAHVSGSFHPDSIPHRELRA